jgi:hypothetical protein
MIDLQRVQFKIFEERIRGNQCINLSEFESCYNGINNINANLAFLCYCAYITKPKRCRFMPSLSEVARDLETTAPETVSNDPYRLIDAAKMLVTFNFAIPIIADYRQRTNCELAFAEITPAPWLYVVLDFLKDFAKEDYPLIENWREFIIFLPQLRQKKHKIYVSCIDYMIEAKNGGLNEWYRKYKAGNAKKSAGYSWKKRYTWQLARMNPDRLEEEYLKHNWGNQLVEDEILKRLKKCPALKIEKLLPDYKRMKI